MSDKTKSTQGEASEADKDTPKIEKVYLPHQFKPGNRFWELCSTAGRKPTFPDPQTLWKCCTEYFESVMDSPLTEDTVHSYKGEITHEPLEKLNLMTLGGLVIFLDISRKTWKTYREKDEFLTVCTRVEEIITQQKLSGAAAGLFNPNIIARDLGLVDRKEQDHKGSIGVHDLTEAQLLARAKQLMEKAERKQ